MLPRGLHIDLMTPLNSTNEGLQPWLNVQSRGRRHTARPIPKACRKHYRDGPSLNHHMVTTGVHINPSWAPMKLSSLFQMAPEGLFWAVQHPGLQPQNGGVSIFVLSLPPWVLLILRHMISRHHVHHL